MKVYLVEIVMGEGKKSLETISLKTTFTAAWDLLGDNVGIITEIVVDEVYPEGIGICTHWHFPDEPGMEE